MKRAVIWCGTLMAGLAMLGALTLRICATPAVFDDLTRLSATRMINVLEGRFTLPSIDNWKEIAGLVVLGGSPDRFVEAFRLLAAHPHLRVVISGASDYEMGLVGKASPEIQARLRFETKSLLTHRNTFGNALYTRELLAPGKGERWLLVTSASHMPRAIGTFHKLGFFVEPWPVRSRSDNVEILAYVARHEWLGLVSYWLRGRTTALLPGQYS